MAVIAVVGLGAVPAARAAGWRLVPTNPDGRAGHAMAYDPVRGRLVLFGGVGTGEVLLLSDTWEYDGTSWRPAAAAPGGPSARRDAAMAFDPARGAVVLFGGNAGSAGSLKADTWLYGGNAWTAGPGAPPALAPRAEHAMVHDAGRGRIVLFGGQTPAGLAADTWELAAAGWQPSAATGPEGRRSHAMAYDALRARTVLFGGQAAAGPLGDTWYHDGATWAPGPAGPPARAFHAMAFDSMRGVVVLHGGHWLGDTWELGAAGWTASVAASPRGDHAMAFDAGVGEVVVYGGGPGYLNTTALYDGSAWTAGPPMPIEVPGDSVGTAALLYDASRARLLFHDWESQDSFVFAGSGWERLVTGPPPPARSGAAMAFDTARSLAVLFGGEPSGNDTWLLDDTVWSPGPAAPPGLEARYDHAMAFDESRAVTVLYGGCGAPAPRDTWELDAAGWRPGAATPPPLWDGCGSVMTYDARRQVVVMAGLLVPDIWEYDGSSWEKSAASNLRLGRMAFDVPRQAVVMVGERPVVTYIAQRSTRMYDGCTQTIAAGDDDMFLPFVVASRGPVVMLTRGSSGSWLWELSP